MRRVFVTGATGLLGNNLVRALLAAKIEVRALVRDVAKADAQFGRRLGLELVLGDMAEPEEFAPALQGCDVLFHTAAYFRDSLKGGRHWDVLEQINVEGTRKLLKSAHAQGVRRIVHTSSIGVLVGPRGALIDETMLRPLEGASDYYRSKILADRVVLDHLQLHPDTHACFVLPGWMHGPGDLGPTAAGQFTLDYLRGALPGIPPATFSFVDARDVADAMISAASVGRRGERYLAAGRHVDMRTLLGIMERELGGKAPRIAIPAAVLWCVGAAQEAFARMTGRDVLLSLATVRSMRDEFERTRFDHRKSERELGLRFRPIEATIRDEVACLVERGLVTSPLPIAAQQEGR